MSVQFVCNSAVCACAHVFALARTHTLTYARVSTHVYACSCGGAQVILCNPNRKVIRAMEMASLPDLVGRDNIFVSVHDAVTFATRQLQERGICVTPLCISGGQAAQASSDSD